MTEQPTEARRETETASTRHRVQLDFTPEAFERLRTLRERSEAQTNAEVVRNALRILEWFITEKEKGARIQVIDGDTIREVQLLL
jgi:hypothetical protein